MREGEPVAEQPVMLIVDDVETNRVILSQFFQSEYQIRMAENGKEAWDILAQEHVHIVLADLVMPVMDGYALLAAMKKDERTASIPVIVMTGHSDSDSEVRAMEMGAADFITKPYNPIVVRYRVRNVMARLENEWRKLEQAASDRQLEQVNRSVERDSLTDLYNREAFYRRAARLMQEHMDEPYAIVYLDVSCFKVVNDLFRIETGNIVLKTAAYYFKAVVSGHGVVGRLEADHFAICLPASQLNMDQFIAGLDSAVQSLGISHNIIFYAGVYPVEDQFLPVDQMCDRARMALERVRGSYIKRYSYYDKSMREQMLEEQMLVRDMEFGLQDGQFRIFLQPVYNLHTHHIVSAEALVRWQHPTSGLISPGKFIPLFERNGFIVRLDRFVWEAACRYLRRQLDMFGQVVPVSANVSRLNFYNEGLLEYMLSLIAKYELQPWMLKLEVTETAYTENPQQLSSAIKAFQAKGFKILMDDFGSGYSSLNMLKNLPVDVLKIDMGFVSDIENEGRARIIMEQVVHMAQLLGMEIVIEGVETKPQIDFLEKIGCEQIQGYYFAKPMAEADFTQLLVDDKGEKQS